VKLLVATDFPPDAPGGGPAVVRQMLRSFPGEIHWWSCRRSAGSRYKLSAPAGQTEICLSSHTSASPGVLFPQRRLTLLKSFFMELVWARWATSSLLGAVRTIQPEQLWFIPHDWSILPLYGCLTETSTGNQAPPLHATIQDFPDVHRHQQLWGSRRVARLKVMQEAIYRRADSRDATSLPMLEELRARTGSLGDQMLHAGLEKEDFAYLQAASRFRSMARPVRIAYAGTILVEEEFHLMVESLRRLRTRLSGRLSLDIWSSHTYRTRSWFDPAWMTEHAHASEQELRLALRECDWGFCPMALGDEDPRYNRFSFPTKFITYLAAGLPILALGHPESSVQQLMKEFTPGISLKSPEDLKKDDWSGELVQVSAKERYRQEILRCATELFDADEMRARLWKSLTGQGSLKN
jgi:hypothetical protein